MVCEGKANLANLFPARLAFKGDYRSLIGRFEVDTWGYECQYHCGASVQTTPRYMHTSCAILGNYIRIVTVQLCYSRNVLTFLIAGGKGLVFDQ